jgi:hypothetical protein
MISCDLQAVIVSGDSSVLSLLPSWLKNMGIRPMAFGQAASALETLRKQRVDAIFVDCDVDPDFLILKEMRETPAGRKLIGMALVSAQTPIREAFRFSEFVIDKPLVQQRVEHTLRAAHGIMVRDRMQYTRLPLATEAMVFNCQARSAAAVATNVSQTGIALESSAQFVAGEIVQIHFQVPGLPQPLACRAKAIWSDGRSKAGFSFLEMKLSDREALTCWIENQFIEGWQEKVPQAPFMSAVTDGMVGIQLRSA